jgi:aspartyl-tRNA(Asn)/glutamyl-tRNA(Gln) amidotransferase subunit A
MDILRTPAIELANSIRNKTISSVEVTRAFLDRIANVDDSIKSFINVDHRAALDQAARADQSIANGTSTSILTGVPIAIKDNLCTTDGVTSCASKILANYRAPYESTVVGELRSAGMVIVGKTNMDEFAMGSSTENSAVGPTKNPWDHSRAPGGSSGGSAACIASQEVPLSLGSDTGGSIRQPASLCGICGLKPTYGRVSRFGLVAFASSLDQIGPFANDCLDLAALLQVIAGHDPKDSTSVPAEVPNYVAEAQSPMKKIRVGVMTKLLESKGIDDSTRTNVKQAIEVFRDNGAEIIDIELPHAKFGIATYYIIASSEASSNLSRYSGVHYGFRSTEPSRDALRSGDELVDMICDSRSQGFGAEVKRRIMLGTYTLSAGYYDAYYLKALKVRRLIRNDFDKAFDKVDVILGPTTPSTAFKIGAKTSDPIAMYLEDLFTVGANLAGIPALSLPSGFANDGLPTAIQLQASVMQEAKLLQAGHWYQKWSGYQPAWPSTKSTIPS